jgi:ABC-type phosphate/phosphonate transport system substrate-binding protein
MKCCRLLVVLASVIGGSGIASDASAQHDVSAAAAAKADLPRALLAVPLRTQWRDADEQLTRNLGAGLGIELRHDDGFGEYRDLIERVLSEDTPYVARMTPYAFVAAQMLGARLEVLGTYESAATHATTYRSYFVVNAKRFEAFPATLEGVYEFLKSRSPNEPARFVYHSRFSTSSYLLPALWFRTHRIFSTRHLNDAIVRIDVEQSQSGEDSIARVAADEAQIAAVSDDTKQENNPAVLFIPLPLALPNDLLVAPAWLSEPSKAAVRAAIERSPEIGIGDFKRWRSIDRAREALDALNQLNRVARAAPAPVVVRVIVDGAGEDPQVAARLEQVREEVRQAVRLAGTELVVEEPKFHQYADVIWTVHWIHDGAILLESDIQARRDVGDRLRQQFHLSFTPAEGDLTRRVVSLIHSRMHRIRYVWPYDERAPTVIRDVDFSLPKGDPVYAQRVTWRDPDRNAFVPSEWVDTRVMSADPAKFVLDRRDFIRTDAEAIDYQNPLSDVAYRVILERPSNESRQSRILAAAFVGLFLLAGVGAGLDLRCRLRPRIRPVPRTLPEMCAALAARVHGPWSQRTLTDANVLACHRPRVEEQIEDLKAQRLVPPAMGGITRLAYSIGAGIPFAKGVSLDASRRVELVIDPTRVSNTLRLTALLRLLVGRQLLSPFVGVPLEWEGLNELARSILPDAEPGDVLIRHEDETVIEFASRHFNRVLDDGTKQLSLLPGSWLVSRRDGRCLAQQHIPLPAHLTIRGTRISALRLEFNVADDVEVPIEPESRTMKCWVLGKLVRTTIDQESGSTLSLHLRTVALLLEESAALNAVVMRLARDIDTPAKHEEGA